MKIVVPTLFGYTEEARLVKRSVTVTTASGKKQWDRASYLADAEAKVGQEQAKVIEALLDHCIALECDVTWGKGALNGSFNVKEPTVCPRSLITCYSNGDLIFNFNWLNGSESAERANKRLKELVTERLGFAISETGAAVRIGEWSAKEEAITSVLKQLVSESRAVAA